MEQTDHRFRDFFYKPENSTKREALLLNKLLYDVQLSSALAGQYIKAYRTDVDDNGYDLIFDTEMVSRKIQVKSRMLDATTTSWDIKRGLLRPELSESLRFGMSANMEVGVSGGVILQEVKMLLGDIEVSYHYTDLSIIRLFQLQIIGNRISKRCADKLIQQLNSGHFHDKVKLQKSLFLKAKSATALIEMMGLTSSFFHVQLKELLYRRRHKTETLLNDTPKEHVEKDILTKLQNLCLI
ncbi:hypothetical protein [Pseudoalteromonas luteoviolacea]|uniref:hypothetical protein n=1 Tax=Pseudoalteromonas luteoviolacea TaxID=43657 RepID=UPI001B37A675|nr:hypothetical protein [Pseudoalteromonas luteoviolacea]MBQ4836816.1 hypothetical protein [Pseudoalteromonas luteoviolacea]